MMVTVMQVLDTSITNVALPHMQGSFSASIDEMSWVITSYLAANAVIIPASGWLTSVFGRRRFYLICTVIFTTSSFLSGIAPNLEFLVAMRILQGLGGGPVIPMAQAIMWEIFPLRERGTALAVWGFGIMLAPILGPTVGGWIADNWSWRWIFYINLPIGVVAFFMISAFLFDASFHRKPRRVDVLGIVLMMLGFGCLQLVLDVGERQDWFDSTFIVTLSVLAVCMLTAFVVREIVTEEPILDLSVFRDRNFGVASIAIFLIGLSFNSSILLVALYTQKILGYDAWTAGLTLAPGGLGTMLALMISGRLVSRMDQRLMLAFGCIISAVALGLMTHVTATMDFWNLAWPRFIQGFSMGFIFVPLQALALATIRTERLANATAAYNVVRNIGGSVGVAVVTTILARRSQVHQATLIGHLHAWNPAMADRLQDWTDHFVSQGADSFTASRRAMAMLYREAQMQAQVLSYGDDFWLLLLCSLAVLALVPFMRRVRAEPAGARQAQQARARPRPSGRRGVAPPGPRTAPVAHGSSGVRRRSYGVCRRALCLRWTHMTRQLRRALLAIGALLAVAAPATGQEIRPTLDKFKETGVAHLGYRETSRPFSFVGSDGKPTGYSIDLCLQIVAGAQQSLKLSTLRVQWAAVTPADRIPKLVKGTIDLECGSTTITFGRMEQVAFSHMTFVDGASLLATTQSGITAVKDLGGKRVGVIPNTTTEKALTSALLGAGVQATIVTVNDHGEGLQGLEEGRLDAYASDRHAAGRTAGDCEESVEARAERRALLDRAVRPHAAAGRQRLPGEREPHASSGLYRSGGLVKIYERWFGSFASASPLVKALYQLHSWPD